MKFLTLPKFFLLKHIIRTFLPNPSLGMDYVPFDASMPIKMLYNAYQPARICKTHFNDIFHPQKQSSTLISSMPPDSSIRTLLRDKVKYLL